jgi:hypothetical protein
MEKYQQAIDHYVKALAIFRQIPDFASIGVLLNNIIKLYQITGQKDMVAQFELELRKLRGE